MQDHAGPLAPTTDVYPPLRAALRLMSLLFLTAVLYNIDRLIVGVLAEQIRGEVRISEVQMSLLIGAAYSLLGGTVGIAIGFIIDRTNRSRVLAISLAVWSLATIGGGLSLGFGWLFLARALVGLGETAMAPATLSLIADLFPPGKRGRAMGVYSIGAVLGSSLSTIIPGLILGADLHWSLPVLGRLSPWRITFVLCGLAGLVIAALMLMAREPARQGVLTAKGTARAGLALNLRYLTSQASVFGPFFLGLGVFYISFLAITAWTTVFLARQFHLPLNRFSGVLGLTLFATGILGYVGSGVVLDIKWLRGTLRKLGLIGCAPLLALPSAFAVLAPSLPTALIMLGAMTVMAPMMFVANAALVQDLLPNNMRAFALALFNAITAVLGVTGGPLLVALLTEHVFKDPRMIGYAMMITTAPCLVGASLCYWLAAAGVRRHLAKGSPVAEVMRAAGGI
jgi:MFS family permease